MANLFPWRGGSGKNNKGSSRKEGNNQGKVCLNKLRMQDRQLPSTSKVRKKRNKQKKMKTKGK